METMFATVVELYQKISLIDSFIFFLYCLIGSGAYFFLKVYGPQKLKEHEEEIKNEKRKVELVEKAFQQLGSMMKANTETIRELSQTIIMLNQTFEKVSDKLYSHDERTSYIGQMITEVKDGVNDIKETSPSGKTIDRLHERIDKLVENSEHNASKEDIKIVVDKMDKIHEVVNQINIKVS